jgi:hypothetical protein
MISPIPRRAAPAGSASTPASPALSSSAATSKARPAGASFRDFLQPSSAGGAAPPLTQSATTAPTAPGSAPEPPWAGLVRDVAARRREIDAMMQRALRGEDLGARELLLWQSQVYTYSQQVELVSRIADRTVQGIKLLLNTQL